MKSLRLIDGLKVLIRRKSRKICFFFLRGGLGNQLFQINSLAHKSSTLGFNIVFCDVDVKKNPRDKSGASGLKLNLQEYDSCDQWIKRSSRTSDFFIRIVRSSKMPFLRLPNINFDESEILPNSRIFTAYGYLQNEIDFLSSPGFRVPSNLSRYTSFPQLPAKVALHIRATDSLVKSEMVLTERYYRSALDFLNISPNDEVDVYSDDTVFAKNLCLKIGVFKFKFMEELQELSALQLLANLSNYNYLINSKSTLTWWASVFAEETHSKTIIVSPWKSHFHLTSWFSTLEN